MLPITENLRTLVGELDSAIHICDKLLEILEDCPKEQLTDRVGIFAMQMPDYKILTQERKSAIDLVCRLCTQRIPIENGKAIIRKARAELENTRKLINL